MQKTNTTQTRHPRPLSLERHNQRQQAFSRGVERYQQLFTLAHQGYIDLGGAVDNAPVYLPPELLDTHVMIQAPTGHGKTFLARLLFRELARKRVAILVDDPKHDSLSALEEDCAGLRLGARVTISDTSDQARTPLINPLKKNGIRVEDQAQWMLIAMRACFNQDNFDQTPQRPRWMFNSILPVIEGEGTFDDVLSMLNYHEVGIRRTFVERTSNALVRKEWLAYEELSMTRRRDETASAFAWLRKFCLNETLRHIFTPSPTSFDFGQFLRSAGILLQSFPRYRPLDEDSVDFLRSLSFHSLLAQAFHIPLGMRPPLYLILDEAEHALERDSGLIETILNEGRSLGIHLCLLFHDFSQVAQTRPALLESVLTNCRTKIIGGHLTQANLDILTSELFVNEWHPHIIRDQLTSLEVEPCETTRKSYSRSRSGARGKSIAISQSETNGTSEAETTGESFGENASIQETTGTVDMATQGRSHGRGMSDTASRGGAHVISAGGSHTDMESSSSLAGRGIAHGANASYGSSEMAAGSEGASYVYDPMQVNIMPQQMTTSANDMMGQTSSAVSGTSDSANEFSSDGTRSGTADTENWSEADSTNWSRAHTTSESDTESSSIGKGIIASTGISQGTSHEQSNSVTLGSNHSETQGVTEGTSKEEGWSESETIAPFHELKKRWRVASREFLSLADFLTTKLIQLKSQPKMHWAIQPPEGKTVFFKARFVKPLAGGRERLAAFRAQVFSKPWYHRVQQHDATSVIDIEARTLPAPETKSLPPHSPAVHDDYEPPTFRHRRIADSPTQQPGHRQEKS